MKKYHTPELRLIVANEHVMGTAWEEWSFNRLEGLFAEDSPSLVGLDIDNNPEGNPDD